MPGDDVDWIREALDRHLITLDEALSARDGLGPPEPSIKYLALLLVPRGMAPESVAAVAEFGVGWGEDSDRANKLVGEFEELAESGDDSVAAVGRAGVSMYTQKLESALAREKVKRIRGEF